MFWLCVTRGRRQAQLSASKPSPKLNDTQQSHPLFSLPTRFLRIWFSLPTRSTYLIRNSRTHVSLYLLAFYASGSLSRAFLRGRLVLRNLCSALSPTCERAEQSSGCSATALSATYCSACSSTWLLCHCSPCNLLLCLFCLLCLLCKFVALPLLATTALFCSFCNFSLCQPIFARLHEALSS